MTNQNDGMTQSIENQLQSTTMQLANSGETCDSCFIEGPNIVCINPHTGQKESRLISESNCLEAIAYRNLHST